MQKRMVKRGILALLWLLPIVVWAQDPHFSQYFSSPLTFNPAFTGYFEGTQRLAVNFRNQWANVSNPYTTGTFSFDTKILRNTLPERDKWGLGVMGLYDVAAGGVYKNNYIAFSTGYNKGLDAEGNQSIGIGVQAVYARNVVDFSKISFSNQFSAAGFDLTIPSGETVNNRSVSYADLNAGLVYQYGDEEGNRFNLGASVFHLLQPKLRFFSGNNNSLARRYTVHASAYLNAGEQDQVFIGTNLMQQARNTQVVIGGAYGFGVGTTDVHFFAGGWLRVRDAFYPYIGLQTSQYQLGISYDVTNSDLRKANGFTGSSELSFIYFFRRNKQRGIPCFF